MADMENFNEEYERISKLLISQEIAKELKNKSPEFCLAYHRMKRKTRNAKYVEKSKDDINQRRREKYAELKKSFQKPIVAVIPKAELSSVVVEAKREAPAVPRLNNELSENTIIAYTGVVKKIYKHYNNKELPTEDHLLKYLNNIPYNSVYIWKKHSYIIDNVEDIFNNFQNDIPHLYSVFSKFKGKYCPQIAEKLYPYMTAVNKNYTDNRNKNIYVNEDAVSKVSFIRDEVLSNMEKLNDDEKLLYGLLFLIPSRRLHDFRFMRHVEVDDIEKEPDFHLYNWIVGGDMMIIHNTKNKDKIQIPLCDELKKIIFHHKNAPYNTDKNWILGKFYQAHQISRYFSQIMAKVYDYNFGCRDIRRIYCTQSVKNMTSATVLKKEARETGHNLEEHINYVLPPSNISLN